MVLRGPFEAIGRSVVEGLRRIKLQDGPNLILSGSSSLTSTALEHGVADELIAIIHPVLLGTGKRVFADSTPAQTFEFVNTQTPPTGVTLTTYKVLGPLKKA
jgi:dihydrofolate reductase